MQTYIIQNAPIFITETVSNCKNIFHHYFKERRKDAQETSTLLKDIHDRMPSMIKRMRRKSVKTIKPYLRKLNRSVINPTTRILQIVEGGIRKFQSKLQERSSLKKVNDINKNRGYLTRKISVIETDIAYEEESIKNLKLEETELTQKLTQLNTMTDMLTSKGIIIDNINYQLTEINKDKTDSTTKITELQNTLECLEKLLEENPEIYGLLQYRENSGRSMNGGKSNKKHTSSKHTSKKLKPTSKPKRPQSAPQLMKKKSSLKKSH